jgi:membrane protease YdiL (CAAX protease family)
MHSALQEDLLSILLSGSLSLFTLWMAKRGNFFQSKSPFNPKESLPLLSWVETFGVFAIYFATLFFIGEFLNLLFGYLLPRFVTDQFLYSPFYALTVANWVQLSTLFFAVYFLYLFCTRKIERHNLLAIWKRPYSTSSLGQDIAYGIISWMICYPTVFFVNALFDFFITLTAGPQEYEQVAVHYLKVSLGTNSGFLIALFTILLAAPILEEFLFRGFLLNLFRRYFGKITAIFLSSLAFALFHFSFSQNLGNISLIASLFTFAIFLGYIYERQGSLFASIALHMMFNIVNTIRILT